MPKNILYAINQSVFILYQLRLVPISKYVVFDKALTLPIKQGYQVKLFTIVSPLKV